MLGHTLARFTQASLYVGVFVTFIFITACRGGGDDSNCGDGVCQGGENYETCPEDCSESCGNGLCDNDENSETCPADCVVECGDGRCTNDETFETCPEDCTENCGNGTCEDDETPSSCPADCFNECGDGTCNSGETFESCPEDCVESCGNGTCDSNENPTSCPQDCESVCGDGSCTTGENNDNCPEDCSEGCGNGTCDDDENAIECPADCPMECGDSLCSHSEHAGNCQEDCPEQCGDTYCTHTENASECPEDCPAVCGDEACTHDELTECPEDCCTQLIDGELTVNIPVITVTIAFTLGEADYDNISGTTPQWEVDRPYVTFINEDAPSDTFGIYTYVYTDDSGSYDWVLEPTNHTVQLVPGRYRPIYRSGTRDIFGNWPINRAAPLGEAIEIDSSGVYTVDIPRVQPTIDFSLGGSSYTNISGTTPQWEVDRPYVTFANADASSDTFGLYTYSYTDDSGSYDWVLEPTTSNNWLVPGSYSATYTAGTRTIFANWPVNRAAPVGDAVTIDSSGALTVDVPRVQPTIDFTLGGSPYTNISGTTPQWEVDRPYVTFVNADAPADTFGLYTYSYTDDSGSYDWVLEPTTSNNWLVPGSYSAIYTAGTRSIFSAWPVNRAAPVGDPVGLDSSGALTVDVPRVQPTIEFTLGGSPYTNISGTTPQWEVDRPYVTFVNADAPADTFGLYTYSYTDESGSYDWVLEPTMSNNWLVPGSYTAIYTAGTRSIFDGWPINRAAPVGDAITFESSDEYLIDVPRVQPTIDFSLGGAAYTNISGTTPQWEVDRPYVTFANADAPADTFGLYTYSYTDDSGSYDWVLEPTTSNNWLVPGNYSAIYTAGTRSIFANWPINRAAPLGDALAIESSGALTVDVPRIQPIINFTLDGAIYSDISGTTPQWEVDRPRVTFINANAPSDTFGLYTYAYTDDSGSYDWVIEPTTSNNWLVPGTYQTVYTSGTRDIFDEWPYNSNAPLGCVYIVD